MLRCFCCRLLSVSRCRNRQIANSNLISHKYKKYCTMASQKATCSYGPACYRRNIEHFRQMSHPHLDSLLDSVREDSAIIVPEKLDFPCTSRTLLKEQLEVLRTVRKTKSERGEPSRANVQGTADEKVKIRQMTREQILSMMRMTGDAPEYLAEQGKFAEKHRNAAPYYIFFTTVQKAKATWSQKYSVTLPEILDKSLGKITFSLHLNFVVDVGWLCAQYLLAQQKADMVIFYGEKGDDCPLPANIKMHKITCPNKFGCHHSKLSIFQYEDNGIRVVVSTANLYKDDWYYRTQGLWISPHLPRLPTTASASDGESKTGFKEELLQYLGQYGTEMERCRAIVKRTDFSAVNVALVFSVPGTYRPDNRPDRWGHKKLATVLKKHVEIPDNETSSTIIAQASSMGNFGATYNSWLGSQLGKSMVKTAKKDGEVTFKVIYPTIDNYKQSYDMREAVNCLCYTERGHMNQLWLRNHLHKWVANHTARSSAVPHIKTFTRISSDERKLWWFVLGSANLSKAAWGYAHGISTCVLNYEASVVFLPKFVTGSTSFPIKSSSESGTPSFPIPYDLPLVRYSQNDKPFVTEFFQKGDDVLTA